MVTEHSVIEKSRILETTRACYAYLQICIRNLTAELIRR